ncbi:MAG: hypothetical protein V3S05_11850, partial [Desulfobacterales bacterium]
RFMVWTKSASSSTTNIRFIGLCIKVAFSWSQRLDFSLFVALKIIEELVTRMKHNAYRNGAGRQIYF